MSSKETWISVGYRTFAYQGSSGIRVEAMAREVGKNKSTFYHHFLDVSIFLEDLTMHHLKRAREMASSIGNADGLTELASRLMDFKDDLFFNRQLRVERDVVVFQDCFQQTNQFVGDAFMQVWPQILGLDEKSHLARLFLKVCVDNFFLRISPKEMDPKWLERYFEELRELVKAFTEPPS